MTFQRQLRLLILAAVFLFIYSIILTLSPAVRERSWNVSYRLSHWIGFIGWIAVFSFAFPATLRRLPDSDPYLLPLAAMLSGWGLLTIWRLDPNFGLRQVLWLGVSALAVVAILYLPGNLSFLRRYKYILLTGGLFLTALTLILGTNPNGAGPRLWLGCCGFYLQPSEPLKLLLVVYLAAYLADNLPIQNRFFPLFVPTIFLTGIALLLLVVQRDLGTACIFIILYSVILFVATGKKRILIVTAGLLILAGLVGYFFIGIVQARIDSWINPWNDPSGHSYQIVQSLLAVANGGIIGRGPGLGSPGLVPVAQSDFIFSAIAEETGLAGAMALFAIFGLIFARGLLASLRAIDRFHRLLAAGLTAYIGIQSLLIVGGNLRIMPLTGVTLPFVSYGGSSLLTSFIAISLLLIIGNRSDNEPPPLTTPAQYYLLAGFLGIGLISATLADTWWSSIRAAGLLSRTDNPRLALTDRYVLRGSLLDRNNQPIDITLGQSGSYQRYYLYPNLASLTGYTQATYGQAGLEATLDDYLRGLRGNPASLIWWDHLLYGTPPPGLDVRLSIDLDLQKFADQQLGDNKGAVVLLNAQTGEILVMASHPTYDPNKLGEVGSKLAIDPNTPLVNRAAQGMYPPGTSVTPFIKSFTTSNSLDSSQVKNVFQKIGFFTTPEILMPVAPATQSNDLANLRISPLQMATAAAAISNNGMEPPARIAIAVDVPQQAWVILPPSSSSKQIFAPETANSIAKSLANSDQPYWEWSGVGNSSRDTFSWYLAGTLPNWQGTPLDVVVLLEGNYPITAESIGQQLLQTATKP